jgi:phosphoglycolate phosphatase
VSCSVDAILFDKDGTLLEGPRTWTLAASEALSLMQPPQRATEAVRRALGLRPGPVPALVAGAPLLWMSNPELAAAVEPHIDGELFVTLLGERVLGHLQPVEGAEATVLRLRDLRVPVGVATNDSMANTRAQFGVLGWEALFDTVVGHDSGYPAKPDPAMIVGAAQALGARRPAFVGDSDSDMAAARAAGAHAVYFNAAGATHEAAHASIRSLAQLLDDHVGDDGAPSALLVELEPRRPVVGPDGVVVDPGGGHARRRAGCPKP